MAPLLIALTWLTSFLGPVFVIYGMRGNNTLTQYESIGCVLLAYPPAIIVTVLLSLLTTARQSSPKSVHPAVLDGPE